KIGSAWEKGNVALAQVYMSSKICEELVEQFLPSTTPEGIQQARMGITLLDDYHALGKMIISATLRASGYELQDYGRLTATELVQRVCDDQIQIILISTLMLRSALQVKEVKNLLTAAGSSAKIIVGGAPFNFDSELWREVGADDMGTNAADAIRAVARCMEKM
ncbi:MAG: cobalamin B12-binding domain-containing protein, partial [Candidatus Electrothrix sp. AR3]|nr:cobalamin B12-binding domain-containing protein [Candidatus Electrothrix sp. AR3]